METPGVSRETVLRQLERLQASGTFAGAGRSSALLRFLVEHALDDRTNRLKEYTLGVEALGKGESFDPRIDPIVRAEASRLRKRLEHYYAAEGRTDALLVTLPKGSYVPRFGIRAIAEPNPRTAEDDASGRRVGPVQKLVWFGLGAATVAALFTLAGWSARRRVSTAQTVAPLTALPGLEMGPTFSPDGRSVAFSWDGEKGDANRDIYVKLVGASDVQRLTTDTAADLAPSWSADGRHIAFLRVPSLMTHAGSIHLVSPLGGPARKIGDFSAVAPLSWSPDGKALIAARAGSETTPSARGIYLVPTDGSEPRPLTHPQLSGPDRAPALSPDGKHLAYVACATPLAWPCHLNVLGLDAGFLPRGTARRLTPHALYSIQSIAWTADGSSLVYDTEAGPQTFYLWRVAADGTTPPERVDIAGVGARMPSISGTRLAFTRWIHDPDIVRFAPGRPREVFAASTYWEGSSQFSPDGRRVAFESMRSGESQEIWLASAAGEDPRQLTSGPGHMQGSPAWSPDGRRIAFDSQGEDGHWDIWTIDPDGAAPVRLTRHAESENVPSWSRDGRWVYYHASRADKAGIFRIPATGGAEEPVLWLEPGSLGLAQESADGRTLLYTTGARSPLFAHPLAGGADRKLVDCVLSSTRGFFSARSAVYYAGCEGMPDVTLHRLDPATGEDRALGTLEQYRGSLVVSPDDRTVLYTSLARTGADLMLVEGFR
jgi:Tol biopolymer transport system component